MDRLHAMQVFVRAAETGGFAPAARQLNLSAPAVTRAIAALEDVIGAKLFVRTTRAVKLTEAGERYFADCKRILADIAEAEGSASGSFGAPTGTLTISASVLFGELYVLPILTEYIDRNPGVTGRLLLLDRVTNLVEEGIDVAVRIGHLPDSAHSAIRVAAVRRLVCGAPGYIEARGIPRIPADLLDHRIIAPTAAWTSLDWRFGPEGRTSVHITPSLYCNTNQGAINATLSGWGLTRLLSYQIGPYLIDGRLRAVLAEHETPPYPVHVIHPQGRRASAKVRAFVDLAVARLRANRLLN